MRPCPHLYEINACIFLKRMSRKYGRALTLAPVSQAREDNATHDNLLAWFWRHGEEAKLVVVNYSSNPAQGRLKLLSPPKPPTVARLRDELTGTTRIGDSKAASTEGIQLDLPAWNTRIFDMNGGLPTSSRL